jgi:hypothetical protein
MRTVKGSEFKYSLRQVFSHLHVVQSGPGDHPASYPMGIEGTFSGGNSDHSPPSSAEVKNKWLYTSTPDKSSWRSDKLVKHRDNFTFTCSLK